MQHRGALIRAILGATPTGALRASHFVLDKMVFWLLFFKQAKKSNSQPSEENKKFI